MVKNKVFMGSITTPSIEGELNRFIKDLTQNQIIDVKFSTNLANIKKGDGTTDLLVVSSAILIYDD